MKEFILPCRDLVVHPKMTVPVYVDNPTSISCLETAAATTQRVVIVPQYSQAYPSSPNDIYEVGTIGDVVQVLRMPDGAIHAIIKTTGVVRLSSITVEAGLFSANVEDVPMNDDMDDERIPLLREKIYDNLQSTNLFRKLKLDKLRNVIQGYPLPAFIDSVIQTAEIDTDMAIKTAIEAIKIL